MSEEPNGANTALSTNPKRGLRPPWKKGQSGNPKGRPKSYLSDELAKQLPKEAREIISKLIRRSKRGSNDLKLLWDRAEGAVEREPTEPPSIKVVIVPMSVSPATELKDATDLTTR